MAATATGVHHRSYTSELKLRATSPSTPDWPSSGCCSSSSRSSRQLLAVDRQHDPHRGHRCGRAEHPRRLHRPDSLGQGGFLAVGSTLGDPVGPDRHPGADLDHHRGHPDRRRRDLLRSARPAPQGSLPRDRDPGQPADHRVLHPARLRRCADPGQGLHQRRTARGRSLRDRWPVGLRAAVVLDPHGPGRALRHHRATCSAPAWAVPSWPCGTRTSPPRRSGST